MFGEGWETCFRPADVWKKENLIEALAGPRSERPDN